MMNEGPILLTGVAGQVGGYALPMLRELGNVIAPDRITFDLRDEQSIRDLVRSTKPRWIVNTAAYTAVDRAESDRDAAYAVNADAPRILGEEAAKLGSPVLHFSTDYVFSGEGNMPWREDDATGAVNVYGASKLAGEQALAATGAPYLIFRTSWVYGARGKNFLLTILRLVRERDELRIVNDQVGSPTSAESLAQLIRYVIHACECKAQADKLSLAEVVTFLSGVYHASDSGYTTWYGFAEEFVGLAKGAEPSQAFAKLIPICTKDFSTQARRPLNSRMNTALLQTQFGYAMPRWQDATAKVMREVFSMPHMEVERSSL